MAVNLKAHQNDRDQRIENAIINIRDFSLEGYKTKRDLIGNEYPYPLPVIIDPPISNYSASHLPNDYCLIAVDGSHIDTDRHLPTRCFLINTGTAIFTYGSNSQADLINKPKLYVQDKELVIKDVMKILKPGGRFAFNSSFFNGAHPEHTLGFYRKWMFKAMRILSKEYNTRPVKAEKIESRVQLNPDQYKEILENCGMKIMSTKLREVDVPIDGWLDISGFKDFIEGVMPGVSLDVASQSLQKAVRDTFKEMKLNFVQRNWMEIVATKA